MLKATITTLVQCKCLLVNIWKQILQSPLSKCTSGCWIDVMSCHGQISQLTFWGWKSQFFAPLTKTTPPQRQCIVVCFCAMTIHSAQSKSTEFCILFCCYSTLETWDECLFLAWLSAFGLILQQCTQCSCEFSNIHCWMILQMLNLYWSLFTLADSSCALLTILSHLRENPDKSLFSCCTLQFRTQCMQLHPP